MEKLREIKHHALRLPFSVIRLCALVTAASLRAVVREAGALSVTIASFYEHRV